MADDRQNINKAFVELLGILADNGNYI